ncbi:MAG: hypothetical protein V8S24_13260 [Gordonibacter pamelaeae]
MRSKVVATVIMLLLGVCMLVFIMVQTQNYASIIVAGVVRGATQRAVKLEIANLPNDEVVERVDETLASLFDREEQRPVVNQDTGEFMDALLRVQDKWDSIKQQFDAPDAEKSSERLLTLSEEHFKLADETVLLAQLDAPRATSYGSQPSASRSFSALRSSSRSSNGSIASR